jgi:hypothetical protein
MHKQPVNITDTESALALALALAVTAPSDEEHEEVLEYVNQLAGTLTTEEIERAKETAESLVGRVSVEGWF